MEGGYIFYLPVECLLLIGFSPSGTHIVVDKNTSISTLMVLLVLVTGLSSIIVLFFSL